MNALETPVMDLVKTRAGLALDVRAVTVQDEPLLEQFFEKVSDEDRRFRFLNAAAHVGHQQLQPIVEVAPDICLATAKRRAKKINSKKRKKAK